MKLKRVGLTPVSHKEHFGVLATQLKTSTLQGGVVLIFHIAVIRLAKLYSNTSELKLYIYMLEGKALM